MTIQCKLNLYLLVILSAFSINISAVSAGSTELSSGIASYSSGNYPAAVVHLVRAVTSEPANATAHYYLACAYQQTGDPTDAIVEYKSAVKFDREGTIARYASTALTSYATIAPSPSTASGAAKDRGADETKRAEDQISRQAQEGQSIIQQKSAAHVADTQATGNYEEQQLVQCRNATVTRMQNSYWTDKDGNSYPVYTAAQIQEVKSDYDQRINSVHQNMNDDVQKQLAFGSVKTAALKDSVSNLQSLLQPGVARPDGVRLQANGTNLFVRNYVAATASSSTPTPELMATQNQLVLVPHKSDKKSDWQVVSAGQAADQDKLLLSQQKRPIQLKVHGVVVPGATTSK